ncbi:MAG: hypothetical protein JWN25_1572 [Verrucomicrobiales bacterium]|nr:hypothetical protein [Verrucomicrobiales bacterium]
MALIKCRECGREISSLAAACPNCGAPNLPGSVPSTPTVAEEGVQPKPGSYVDKELLPGETITFRTNVHWSRFFGTILLAMLFLGIAVGCFIFGSKTANAFLNYAGIAALLIAGGCLLPAIVVYRTSEFAVTNKRVLIKTGFIRRISLELLLRQVESVLVDQSVLGRMLGYGTIVVIGTGGSREEFDNIANPLEFRKQVQAQTASQ